jgi:peptidoglycan hydrolase-like protein with peptidoglycan-binding domain
MAQRKRKQPEKKRKSAQRRPSLAIAGLGLAGSGLMAAGRLTARNPGVVGGSVAFIVVFSFVAANALWYQPGAHPSPFLRTRLPFTYPDPASLGANETGLDPKKVTTFVIKREDEIAAETTETTGTTQTAVQRPAMPQPLPAVEEADKSDADDVAALIENAGTVVGPSQETVAAIQKELARRGLYDGEADGKLGPKTRAAIEAFESRSGRAVTGEANEALLTRLRAAARPAAVAATPDARPYQNIKAEKGELDAVAAAIRQANVDPQYIPKADIPASSELVMRIQQGLVNLAYADVTVDGVANEKTRAAIRHFEKHYRLPPTGEPSDVVLRKMKSIGAL